MAETITNTSTPAVSPSIAPSVISAKPALGNYTAAQSDFVNNILPQVTQKLAPVTPVVETSKTGQATTSKTPAAETQTEKPQDTDLAGVKSSLDQIHSILSDLGSDSPDQEKASNVVKDLDNGDGTRTVTYDDGTSEKVSATDDGQGNSTYKPIEGTAKTELETAISKINDQETLAYNDYKEKVGAIASGSIPLTASQQTQVNDMKQQLDSAITAQRQANSNYVNALSIIGEQHGNAMYNSEVQADNIHTAITSGTEKIISLMSKASAAMAKMESAFKANDYKAAKDSYDEYNKYIHDRATEITNMQKEIDTHQNQLATQRTKIATEKINAIIKSATLSLKEKSDAINQLVKVGNLTEKQRTEAVKESQAQERLNISAASLNLRKYVVDHPNQKNSIIGGTLDDAFGAIKAGKDPKAVHEVFIKTFPDGQKAWDNYAAGKKPTGSVSTNTSGTGSDTTNPF